ncbi:hypothetical protein DB30_08152 [Enhygromyxa salina]|uniref:Lipoprotein n=1 Tax=Enhygromyxa salina TaxID=215803 RepID=A0A0C2CUX5_9BACT|nr:hypothetical protein [Enhygromyxa salina]KIG13385.1 hypothetical protein DB30_08152 [Enhygromyxa salina]
MRSRSLVGLCLTSALLFGAPLLGCGGGDLVETQVPSDGIELRYDLQPGSSFEGRIKRRETISMRGQPMSRSINFGVHLIVNSVDEAGNAKVAATVSGIDLNWVVPGLPVSMNEFNQRAKARLEGVTIRFSVDPTGKVFDVPASPAELDEAEVGVLESVIEGLTSAFFVVPEKRLGLGEGWETQDTRGREGKLGKFTNDITRGTLVGTFEHRETKQPLAKLEIDGDKTETTTTKDGSIEIRTRSAITVLFDTKGHYMASIDSEMKRSQGATTTTVQFDAEWKYKPASGSGGATSGAAQDEPAVQAITDPCDDNYVGPDDCLDACSVNYMGDEPCADAPDADADADAPAPDAPAPDASGGNEAPAASPQP